MIRCPKTGKSADTGFTMDADTFETATLEGNGFECGQCNDFHTWSKADVLTPEATTRF